MDTVAQSLMQGGRAWWESAIPALQFFTTSFLSALIGALPFIIVAVFASSFLEVFVPREALARWIPRNPVLGVLLAPLVGLVIPMCDCGIVPVARRLVAKGAPLPVAITFMLANPILNPLVFLSTRLAFPTLPQLVWWRMGLGYAVAVVTALTIGLFAREPGSAYLQSTPGHLGPPDAHPTQPWPAGGTGFEAASGGDGCGDDCGHDHAVKNLAQRLRHMLEHAGDEFFSVGRYFIMGTVLATLAQAFVSRTLLERVGQGPFFSVLVMMAFAYLVSVCSEADAFVATTFASTFAPGAVLAFLVFGPMSDVKNTLMMVSAFRRRFVVGLNVVLVIFCCAAGYFMNRHF